MKKKPQRATPPRHINDRHMSPELPNGVALPSAGTPATAATSGAKPLLRLRLVAPEPTAVTLTPNKSWLLPALSIDKAFEVFVSGDESFRNVDFGKAYADLLPKDDGTFSLELGAILPDLLPNLNGKTEYWIDLSDGDETFRLCFSNQMSRLLFFIGADACEAIAPRALLASARSAPGTSPELLAVPPEPLTTVATCRFRIHAPSADDALRIGLYPKAEHFVRLLNRVLAANVALQMDASPLLVSDYEVNTFKTMFFAIKGREPERLGHGKFATNLYRARLYPRDISGDDAARFLELAQGTTQVSDVTLLLNSTRSFLAGGMVRPALLQLAIACETATRRYVHAALLASGTSKSKLEAVEKDLTFSIMLNVLLFSVAPPTMKPDRETVGEIDKLRRLRNTLMHEGTLQASQREVDTLYRTALTFIQYLRAVANTQGIPQP